jgi:putative hydrolase of the HAD superfamily
MTKIKPIEALFVDIGGVMLTDGWNHLARRRAIKTFDLDPAETEERHHLIFDTYESGKLSLAEYLSWVVFYRKRQFTPSRFRKFMFAQSKPFPEMLRLVQKLKARYNLKIIVVSNEGRELNDHRIRKFRLHSFVDFFVSSCFVHLRKPDKDIYKLALDLAQVPVERIIYIENQPKFIQVARECGIRGICHTDTNSTRLKLKSFGLAVPE